MVTAICNYMEPDGTHAKVYFNASNTNGAPRNNQGFVLMPLKWNVLNKQRRGLQPSQG